jgi:hypothetical protein
MRCGSVPSRQKDQTGASMSKHLSKQIEELVLDAQADEVGDATFRNGAFRQLSKLLPQLRQLETLAHYSGELNKLAAEQQTKEKRLRAAIEKEIQNLSNAVGYLGDADHAVLCFCKNLLTEVDK